MNDSQPAHLRFLEIDNGFGSRKLAWRQNRGREGSGPGLLWLSGFRSVMTSTKVSALAAWASARRIGLTSFDYTGHGQSSGIFEDGTIGHWLDDTCHVFDQLTSGSQILVGSSMGGWMALLLLRRHLEKLKHAGDSRIVGLVLIAPAFDMTKDLIWMRMDDDVRAIIENEGVYLRPSRYDDGPYPITRRLIEEGQNHNISAEPFAPGCPVRIIQGLRDPEVPWRHAMRLLKILDEDDTQFTLIKDGGHRLSRPQDLRLIERILSGFYEK